MCFFVRRFCLSIIWLFDLFFTECTDTKNNMLFLLIHRFTVGYSKICLIVKNVRELRIAALKIGCSFKNTQNFLKVIVLVSCFFFNSCPLALLSFVLPFLLAFSFFFLSLYLLLISEIYTFFTNLPGTAHFFLCSHITNWRNIKSQCCQGLSFSNLLLVLAGLDLNLDIERSYCFPIVI